MLGQVWLPLLAIVEPKDEHGLTLRFLDVPALAQALMRISPYRVLSRAVLESPLTEEDLATLSRHELREIRFWRPETVAEVLFNDWD
ncbi:hypothetical protein GCM10012275_31900 [Longimycelium tulufanense]|uniref:Uncharacterized protein n=1 Tax=Longimycelium tulufanense TaxID=907463 RepID=A0A8J3CFD1_9PSEU|nr:hypothetical protein [Longimycelium tulufanense]GGM58311.1 hypothetical protein GCM10012275_31900 [Longimycelium tulufanense]